VISAKIPLINLEIDASEPCYMVRCNDVTFEIDRDLPARNDATIKTFADWVSHARFRTMRRGPEPRTGWRWKITWRRGPQY
jgi:hypothetical protein